jgi:hypothetical protein
MCHVPLYTIPCAEGPAKKPTDPPRAFAKSQTHQPTSRLFFLAFFFKYVFGRFSVSSKTPPTYFYNNSMSKNNSKKIDKNFDVSFSSTFVGFIAFSGVSRRWEFKRTTKDVVQKTLCGNRLQKNRGKIQNRFFVDFFITYHVFGRFSVRGVKNTI